MTVKTESFSTTSLIDLDTRDPEYATRLVDALLADANIRGASDIHFQPRPNHVEVSFRIDGVLQPIGVYPTPLPTDPVVRLLVLANLPTYQTQKPMEGRLRIGKDGVEMRLGTFPTIHGTRAVVRILHTKNALTRIVDLGLPDDIAQAMHDVIAHQDGLMLVTGPAGSGKTTTLYACLRELASRIPRRSMVTIEDPVESVLEGVSQSQFLGGQADAQSAGMSLASALRSMLRQDPEVLLIGEIRDDETAAAALQASLTGHLIFSSLHASDVATALRRLVEMNLAPYLIRSGLRAICSQRLLRRLCAHCKTLDTSAIAIPTVAQAWRAVGCDHCDGTGYRGRLVIAELLRLDQETEAVRAVLEGIADTPVTRLRELIQPVDGWIDLASRAKHQVTLGNTSIAEAIRVLPGLTTRRPRPGRR